MKKVCIVAAKRTPQGRFLGGLAKKTSVELGIIAGRATLQQIKPGQIDQIIVGNVLAAGQGMNIARQIGIGLGIPIDRIAYTVNMMCASGMQSVILAAQSILAGQASVILCGGTESMSNAPYLLDRARNGYKLGDGKLIDAMLRDGLVDSFDGEHMGLTAERIAEKYGISRDEQDAFSAKSHKKYFQACNNGIYKNEVIPLDELEHDEHPRPDTTAKQLSTLRTAFKRDGTVTAGNSSGINDGAAMLVVCDETTATANGWKPLAVLQSWSAVGCDPKFMGLGPVYAVSRLCESQRVKLNEFDTVELNEAFAAQSIACIRQLGLEKSNVNPDGGAIALGHPIGSSGARIIIHLANRIFQGATNKGLAALCVGGGMGVSVILEKYD